MNGNATIQQHIKGAEPAKSNSPFTSATDPDFAGSPKSFGKNTIEINTKKLQRDIDKGKVVDVEIITSKKIQAELTEKVNIAKKRFDINSTEKNFKRLEAAKTDLGNTIRDNEVLIKGNVPKKFIKEIK